MPKDLYGASIILSSPNMHGMGERITRILRTKNPSLAHHTLKFQRFANKEVKVTVPVTVRGEHVFFLHGLQNPSPNDAVMMMLIANNAIKLASASGISLVLPYMPYLRQDRKSAPREPITARLLADLIETNDAVRRVITLDMHADQEQGFFSIPVDNIGGHKVHAAFIREHFHGNLQNVHLVGPDVGAAVRVRRIAEELHADVPVSFFDKRRPKANESQILNFIESEPVAGKDVVLCDDLVDTGGSILHAADELTRRQVRSVMICLTHPVLSGDAVMKFREKGYQVFTTPTIPRGATYWKKNSSWLSQIPVDEVLADAIYQNSLVGGSISKLSQ